MGIAALTIVGIVIAGRPVAGVVDHRHLVGIAALGRVGDLEYIRAAAITDHDDVVGDQDIIGGDEYIRRLVDVEWRHYIELARFGAAQGNAVGAVETVTVGALDNACQHEIVQRVVVTRAVRVEVVDDILGIQD